MRASLIVPVLVRFQARLGFGHRNEHLAVKQLIAQLAVETFQEPFLPWAAWINKVRRRTVLLQPLLNFGSNEFRAVVAADKARNTPQRKQRLQGRKYRLAC